VDTPRRWKVLRISRRWDSHCDHLGYGDMML
jgi:hypothetical protein